MANKKELSDRQTPARWRDRLARLWLNDEEPVTQIDEHDYEQLSRWHRERLDHWAERWP